MPTSQSSHDRSNHLFITYQNGDTDALGELYRLWHLYVKKRVRQSNAFPAAEIDDVASEVWVFIQKDASKWDVNRSGWFRFLGYKIRQVIDVSIRKRLAFKRLAQTNAVSIDEKLDDPDDYTVPIADDQPPVIDYLLFQERVALVKGAIAKCGFPDNVQTILAMKLADHDYAVISKAVDLDRAQVRKLLHTAIKTIRLRLQTVLTD